MDWYYVDRPVRTIEDSFKDLESIFKDKNSSNTPRFSLPEDFYQSLDNNYANINWNNTSSYENNNYVATSRLPLVIPMSTLEDSSVLRSPVQPVQSPLNTLQTLQVQNLSSVVPNQTVTSPQQVQVQPPSATPAAGATSPIDGISPTNNQVKWKAPQKKSSAIIPPWIHIPEYSRFFVIKSSSLEHVKKSFYKGIWSSTFYGNKRLSEAYESLPQGAKIYLLFSVNASGRFCGVAEMSSNLRDDLDTSIWKDNSRYRHAFKVRWIIVRDVHNRSLKQFLIPANDMKPVTNSRDTQEIPATICKSILKLFKYDQSEVQAFLDDDYS